MSGAAKLERRDLVLAVTIGVLGRLLGLSSVAVCTQGDERTSGSGSSYESESASILRFMRGPLPSDLESFFDFVEVDPRFLFLVA